MTNSLSFTRDRSVDVTIGPEDTIYCKVEDPKGYVLFSGFSRCRIVIDRASDEYAGQWTMTVALPGHIVTMKHFVMVTIEIFGEFLNLIEYP